MEKPNPLLAELDALFGTTRVKTKAKAKPRNPLSPDPRSAPREPRYWQPLAVVLYQTTWKCTCGNFGDCAPQLAVREALGKRIRYRTIHRADQFSNLPREIDTAEPYILNDCPSCFSARQDSKQRLLPFATVEVSELALFIESGLRAAEFAETIVDPWNTKRLTSEARELRLNLTLNLKEQYHD